MTHFDSLPPDRQQAILMLGEGTSVAQVARTLKLERRTVTRWFDDLTFKKALNAYLRTIYRQSLARMNALFEKGLDRVESILENPKSRPELVLQAMRMLFMALEKLDSSDLEERISEVEISLGLNQTQENLNGTR